MSGVPQSRSFLDGVCDAAVGFASALPRALLQGRATTADPWAGPASSVTPGSCRQMPPLEHTREQDAASPCSDSDSTKYCYLWTSVTNSTSI